MSEDKYPQYSNIEVPRDRAEKAVKLLTDNGIWDEQGGKGKDIPSTIPRWSKYADYGDKDEIVY